MEERTAPPALAQAAGVAPRHAGAARVLLLLSAVITAALYVVPYGHWAGYPLVLLSTYAHEMGHGLAALLAGARFESLQLFADTSGVALIGGSTGRLGSAFISAGGLVGPSLLAGVLFPASARRSTARVALMTLALALLASCLLVVRNLFGLAVSGGLGLALAIVALKAAPAATQAVCGFLAVQLALSVFSRGDYLFTETALTAGGAAPSDVAAMADALLLPYWFWGGLCGLVSVVVLVVGLWLFWRASSSGA